MRYCWLFLVAACIYGQPALPDSLKELFEKDFAFDIVVVRSFPIEPTLTDTYPLSPFLSGHWRIGVAWHARLYKALGLTVQGGYSWYRHVLRATTASVAPYANLMPDGYRWLKLRQGGIYLQSGLHWRKERQGDLFPRFWIEAGGWAQRQVGSSLKYVALREGRTEKVRWDIPRIFAPWQAGAYLQVGRQWLGASVFYHLLPIFPTGRHPSDPSRGYPAFSRWEVGFLISI